MGNSTTFQGDGKVAYIPVVVNGKQTRQTNTDRITKIRSMTSKELARFLCDIVSRSDGCYDCVAGECCEKPFDGCDNGFEQWLMQECAE